MTKVAIYSSLKDTATANYFVNAFKNLGHDTLILSDIKGPTVDIEVTSFDDVEVILTKAKFEPDLFFFIEGGSMQIFPRGLSNIACLTIWYGIDTHMDYEKHLRISRLFDVTFIAQKQYIENLKADGIKNVFWLPLGFDSGILPKEHVDRIYDVSFVGSNNPFVHPERGGYLKLISENFSNNMLISDATPSEMGRIYAQSKIVFNKSVNNDLNMRYFEALGAGACLVTDSIVGNGVDEIFKRGEDFFEYKDGDSLVKLIRKILSSPNVVDQATEVIKEKIKKNHTYDHRANEVIKTTKLIGKLQPPKFVDYFAAYIYLGLYPLALDAAAQCFTTTKKVGIRRFFEARIIRFSLKTLAVIAKLGLIFTNKIRSIFKAK